MNYESWFDKSMFEIKRFILAMVYIIDIQKMISFK